MGGERLFAGRAFEAAGAGRGGRRKFEAIEIDFGADVVEVLAVKEAVEEVSTFQLKDEPRGQAGITGTK